MNREESIRSWKSIPKLSTRAHHHFKAKTVILRAYCPMKIWANVKCHRLTQDHSLCKEMSAGCVPVQVRIYFIMFHPLSFLSNPHLCSFHQPITQLQILSFNPDLFYFQSSAYFLWISTIFKLRRTWIIQLMFCN